MSKMVYRDEDDDEELHQVDIPAGSELSDEPDEE